jgi:hypothetical protein
MMGWTGSIARDYRVASAVSQTTLAGQRHLHLLFDFNLNFPGIPESAGPESAG